MVMRGADPGGPLGEGIELLFAEGFEPLREHPLRPAMSASTAISAAAATLRDMPGHTGETPRGEALWRPIHQPPSYLFSETGSPEHELCLMRNDG